MRSLVATLGRFLADLSSGSKLALVIALDGLCIPLCMLAAVALRLGSFEAAFATAPWLQAAIGLLALPTLALSGLYRAVIRYVDFRALARASALLAAMLVALFFAIGLSGSSALPPTSLTIFWLVASAYLMVSRRVAALLLHAGMKRAERPRTLLAIYGAGEAGVQFARAMLMSSQYRVVCFLDDRPGSIGRDVLGLPVYSSERLIEAVERHSVAQIVVAIPSASAAQRHEIIRRIGVAGLPIKTLPSLTEIVDGKASLQELREVDVADLLGRDAVAPDAALFARSIAGKVVMVTGAGGSIGSELCRQILTQRPRRLVLVEHSEIALYEITQELARAAQGVPIRAVLGSVLDETMLHDTMLNERVETVYHAAAYKHVPIVEENPAAGIRNNVFGTWAVAQAAARVGVGTCVLISTDKAVRPTNLMGASKRVAELIFQAAALRRPETVFAMVRFGNVLGSSGSVVPLFRRQIQAGGPVTITHPQIIRYFMLIPEAAQLVIQAGAMARGGEVFVLDMGEPVPIVELARSMIRLSGLTERTPENPEGDIEIRVVGLRPGEKLYEELLIGSDVTPSGHPRILCARERHIDPALLEKMLSTLRRACDANDAVQMQRLISNLVPELRPAEEVNAEAVSAIAGR